jgi:hypothetical protein
MRGHKDGYHPYLNEAGAQSQCGNWREPRFSQTCNKKRRAEFECFKQISEAALYALRGILFQLASPADRRIG